MSAIVYEEEFYDLREKVRKGIEVKKEEYAKIIAGLREGRENAMSSAKKGKVRTAEQIERSEKALEMFGSDLKGLVAKPVSD